MHYYRRNVEVVAPADFRAWWRTKVPYYQDGCNGVDRVNGSANGKVTKKSVKAGYKAMAKVFPDKYTCHVYDCGIDGYIVTRTVRKIVNHHITDVMEKKEYKSRPKRIIKGGTLSSNHVYIISYDARSYDRFEHGGLPAEHDEFSE